MKKVLITGAGGFIGRNLTEQLQERYHVIPISRREADLLEPREVEKLFQKQDIDVVIHAATQSTLGKDSRYEELLLKNNLTMFLNLERCRSAFGKMFFLGSGAEYDKRQSMMNIPESAYGTSIPADNYGFSKYMMSRLMIEDDNIYNLRLFGIFGQHENYNYRFISNVICKALLDTDIVIHQNVLFDYLYIKDFCRLLPWFIEHIPRWKAYNVCTGRMLDIRSIAEEVLKQTGSRSRLVVEKEGMNQAYAGSNQRMLQELGAVSFTPIEQAIAEMIRYYKNTDFYLEGNY